MSRRSVRGAFTLIEVVVALAVSGVVLLGARMMLEAVADGGAAIASSAESADRAANGERLIRSLTTRLEVGTDSSRAFAGDRAGARFSSWCDVPGGWQERCDVRLSIDHDGSRTLLALTTSSRLVLRSLPAGAELRYLKRGESGLEWFQLWGASVTAPLAIGVVSPRDTLIFRIGERG